jgi:hypothetical protein
MFNEPDEDPTEKSFSAADRAKDKSDEFRMHAELVAVFEGKRKFDAEIYPTLDRDLARDIQQTMAKLEKSKLPDTPVIDPNAAGDALKLLRYPLEHEHEHDQQVSTNNYHIHRRPGEVMIVRWLAGEQVDSFYDRLQAHFDAALNQFREEEKQQLEWKQDPTTLEYLKALDALEVKMPDRYLRPIIKQHNLCVLSTQTADELDIIHLTDYVMNVPAAEVVGPKNAPPEEPTQEQRAWFFKLFSLRGIDEGIERMCFFTFLQKTEDTFGEDW